MAEIETIAPARHLSIERLIARALRPFARVEPQETVTLGSMTVIAFFLLTAYYMLKTAREPLILLQGGAESKLYAEAMQAALLVGVVQAYGALARRVGRLKLLVVVYAFFMSNLVVFTVLAQTGLRIGFAFFVWVGLFSYTSVAQFWALAADIYSEEQGKRLFAILGVGASLGAVSGSRIAKRMIVLGPRALMIGAFALLVICVALIVWTGRREGRAEAARSSDPEEPIADQGPFRLLLSNRYLLLIAAMTLLLNWVNSTGEYILDRTLLASLPAASHAEATALVGAFKADYFGWYNLVGLVLQLFAVSRILTRLGVRTALLILPAVSFAGYGLFSVVPVLALIRFAKIAENGLDYSVQGTARHALFLVGSRTEKYVGKTLVDTLFVRAGDVVSALLVWVGIRLATPLRAFSMLNLALAGAWIMVVLAIGKEQARRAARGAPKPASPEQS